MKRFLLTASFVAPAVFALFHGCAADDSTATGTGSGNPMTGTGNPTSGASGASSTPSTSMGAGGNGPAVTVTSVGVGGNAGTSVVTSGGGDGGSAVTSGGGGGAGGASGGAGGTGGGSGGTGGKAAGGAGGATGGAGGATGGAGGATDVTIDGLAGAMKSNFGFMWKDAWFLSPCYQRVTADCYTAEGTGCPDTANPEFESRGSKSTETFKLGGTPGQHYLVTFKYNAVAEAKYHSGGSFADPAMVPATPVAGNPGTFNDTATHNNTFYIGCGPGMPCTGAAATAQNATTSTYNVYRLRVLDTNGTTVVGRYYMNAFPANGGWESHRTFKISYTHQIEVVGGGSIEMQSADSNCRAIANCGDGADVTNGACNAPRQLSDIGGDMAQIPATFANIPRATLNRVTGANDPQHWFAQFAHFTITAVVPKP